VIFVLVTAAIAFTVPGFVFAVRALPFIDAMVVKGIKPWSCDICMSFWSTGGFALAAASQDPRLLLCAGPAYTIALIVLSFMERPAAMPPIPPSPMPLADRLEP